MEAKIEYRFADIGHWLARCDHSTNVIELNAVEFPKLSPLYRDYVWIHECVHLLYNVYDEEECNRITDEIFLSRAVSESDRRKRMSFIRASNERSATETDARKTAPLAIMIAVVVLAILLINKK